MPWYDNIRFPGQDPNSASNRLSRALGAGLKSIGQLGGGALGVGTGIYSGLSQLGQRQIRGNAMPSPSFYQGGGNNFFDNMGSDFGVNEGPSSTDQILEQLARMQDPSRYLMDDSAISAQARAAAEAQYGPVIAALRSQQSSAQSRGERNKIALGQMFNQLSDSIRGELPAIQQNYDQTITNTGNQYKALEGSINDQYKQSQADQEAMYKRLNIEAAASETLPQQMRDRDFFVNNARAEGQTQNAALTTEKQGAVDYTNKGTQMARTEGTQRQADLMMQLQDLMAQFESQIGANTAAKEQAYNASKMSLAQQNQSQASERAQRDFTNYIQAINLQRGLRGDALDELVKMSGLNKGTSAVKSLSDIAPRALSLGLPQNSAQSLQNAFTNGLGDPLVLAGMDANTGSPLSAEAKAARIVEQGRQQGLSPQELNALQAMALEYFGRR